MRRLDLGRGDGATEPETRREPNTRREKRPQKWHARFAVFGATGNVYECDVCAVPSCDCPDFTGGRRGGPGTPGSRVCKHLLWLYMRVLGVPRDDPLLCQTALTQAELARLLAAPSAAQRATLAAREAREAYRRSTAARDGDDATLGVLEDDPVLCAPVARKDARKETCPVCFDDVVDAADAAAGADPTSATRVWWCVSGCGSNVHASCMRRWIAKAAGDGDGFAGDARATCPLCRAGWIDQEPTRTAERIDRIDGARLAKPGSRDDVSEPLSPASGARYLNLARFQAGTASGRDLEQYNDFARRAIEKRQREERRREEADA